MSKGASEGEFLAVHVDPGLSSLAAGRVVKRGLQGEVASTESTHMKIGGNVEGPKRSQPSIPKHDMLDEILPGNHRKIALLKDPLRHRCPCATIGARHAGSDTVGNGGNHP